MVRLVNSYFTSLPGRGILSWEEKIMNRKIVLWKLFVSTLYLSAFTFGGGYVIVTLIKQKFVDELHWIEENEMLDLIAIAQSAPGAIAINGAIVVGYKLAGLLGAIVAIIATIIPPFVIITVISYFYELFRDNFIVSKLLSGMQAGVGAVIASVVWDMGGGVVKQKSAVSDFIMVAAFLAACIFRVNVVYIILACIALGVLRTVLAKSSPPSCRNGLRGPLYGELSSLFFSGALAEMELRLGALDESSDVAAVHEQHKKTRENAERNEHGIFRKDRGHRRNGNGCRHGGHRRSSRQRCDHGKDGKGT